MTGEHANELNGARIEQVLKMRGFMRIGSSPSLTGSIRAFIDRWEHTGCTETVGPRCDCDDWGEELSNLIRDAGLPSGFFGNYGDELLCAMFFCDFDPKMETPNNTSVLWLCGLHGAIPIGERFQDSREVVLGQCVKHDISSSNPYLILFGDEDRRKITQTVNDYVALEGI